jgi:hypothetical protein
MHEEVTSDRNEETSFGYSMNSFSNNSLEVRMVCGAESVGRRLSLEGGAQANAKCPPLLAQGGAETGAPPLEIYKEAEQTPLVSVQRIAEASAAAEVPIVPITAVEGSAEAGIKVP